MAAGGFRESPTWIKVTFLCMSIGFLLDLFGFAMGMGDNEDRIIMVLLVVGFLCFLVAFILSLIVTFLDEMRASGFAKICLIIFALSAGVLTIAGIGVWGNRNAKLSVPMPIGCYSSLVAVCGSTLAILASLFTSLDLCGCKTRGK